MAYGYNARDVENTPAWFIIFNFFMCAIGIAVPPIGILYIFCLIVGFRRVIKPIVGITILVAVVIMIQSYLKSIAEVSEPKIREYLLQSGLSSKGMNLRFKSDGTGEAFLSSLEPYDLKKLSAEAFVSGVNAGSIYQGCHSRIGVKTDCIARNFTFDWQLKKNTLSLNFTREDANRIPEFKIIKVLHLKRTETSSYIIDELGQGFS